MAERYLSAEQLESSLDSGSLIEELRSWFSRNEFNAPARQVHPMAQQNGSEAPLLIMPA